MAFQDGVSRGIPLQDIVSLEERTGLGSGLGAIKRMMDEVIVRNSTQGGATIIARKYLEMDNPI